jgi:hypothetical protein
MILYFELLVAVVDDLAVGGLLGVKAESVKKCSPYRLQRVCTLLAKLSSLWIVGSGDQAFISNPTLPSPPPLVL